MVGSISDLSSYWLQGYYVLLCHHCGLSGLFMGVVHEVAMNTYWHSMVLCLLKYHSCCMSCNWSHEFVVNFNNVGQDSSIHDREVALTARSCTQMWIALHSTDLRKNDYLTAGPAVNMLNFCFYSWRFNLVRKRCHLHLNLFWLEHASLHRYCKVFLSGRAWEGNRQL